MKKITFLFAFLIASVGFAQVTLEDFEGTTDWSGFDGATATVEANPSVDGNNGSATVGQIVTGAAGQGWQGASLIMQSNYIDISDPVTNTVSVKVYSTTAFTLLAKVENAQNGANAKTSADEAHTGSGWETLTFTFNENLDDSVGPANGEYGKISFFPNWNGSGWNDPVIDITIAIDDISGTQGAAIQTVVPPTTAAPDPPTFADENNVFSVYSDAFTTDPTFDNFDAGWCGGAGTTEIMIAGNNTLQKNAGVDCQGIDFKSDKQDLSAYTHLHIDMYTDDADLTGDVFNIKLVDFGGGAAEASALEVNINTGTTPAITAGSWVSIDVDITSLGGVVAGDVTRSDVAQIGITTTNLSNVWYDNLYLYVDGTASTEDRDLFESKVFPNPASDAWTISTPNNTIRSVQVFNVLGRQVASESFDSNEVRISVQSLASGIYLARVTTDAGTKTMKLVRE